MHVLYLQWEVRKYSLVHPKLFQNKRTAMNLSWCTGSITKLTKEQFSQTVYAVLTHHIYKISSHTVFISDSQKMQLNCI